MSICGGTIANDEYDILVVDSLNAFTKELNKSKYNENENLHFSYLNLQLMMMTLEELMKLTILFACSSMRSTTTQTQLVDPWWNHS